MPEEREEGAPLRLRVADPELGQELHQRVPPVGQVTAGEELLGRAGQGADS